MTNRTDAPKRVFVVQKADGTLHTEWSTDERDAESMRSQLSFVNCDGDRSKGRVLAYEPCSRPEAQPYGGNPGPCSRCGAMAATTRRIGGGLIACYDTAGCDARRRDKAKPAVTGNRDIPASFITAIQGVIREAQYHGSSNTWSLPKGTLDALVSESQALVAMRPETATKAVLSVTGPMPTSVEIGGVTFVPRSDSGCDEAGCDMFGHGRPGCSRDEAEATAEVVTVAREFRDVWFAGGSTFDVGTKLCAAVAALDTVAPVRRERASGDAHRTESSGQAGVLPNVPATASGVGVDAGVLRSGGVVGVVPAPEALSGADAQRGDGPVAAGVTRADNARDPGKPWAAWASHRYMTTNTCFGRFATQKEAETAIRIRLTDAARLDVWTHTWVAYEGDDASDTGGSDGT